MTTELSSAQFDQLVSMLADNRVAIATGLSDLKREFLAALEESTIISRKRFEELKTGISLTQKTLDVIEEDLGNVQSEIRALAKVQRQHTQALEGLTELASTNFDLIESLQKRIHGESGSISHGAETQGTRPQ